MAITSTTKQSKNVAKIVGLLVENNLKSGTYIKDGKENEYIAGTLSVRVNQTISGQEEVNEIPITVWVGKYTKAGTINPAFESMNKAMTTYTSVAAADNEGAATKVLISSGSIIENIYSPDGATVRSTPRIQTSFINSITNISNYVPEATFTVDIVVADITDETDKEGVPTGRLLIRGMICKYNGAMDYLTFIAENPNAINFIRSYWAKGQTVQISGKIRFTSKTEMIEVPTRFGDPVYRPRTTSCRELIITADSTDVLTDEQKFTQAEIDAGIAMRNQAIEKEKERAKSASNKTSTVATPTVNNYGF